jgi:CHAT domain-containing protein
MDRPVPRLDLAGWRALAPSERLDVLRAIDDLASAIDGITTEIEGQLGRNPADAVDAAVTLAETLGTLDAPPPGAAADLLRLAASALAALGRHDTALDTLEAARGAAAPESVEAARIEVAAMQPLAKLGRVDEAITRGEAACRRLRDLGRADLAARGRFNLANLRKLTGDWHEALQDLDAAAEVLAESPAILATIENTRGECLLQLDRLDEARRAFQQASTVFASLGGGYAEAMTVGNLADLEARAGRFHEGLASFDRAIVAMGAAGSEPQQRRLEIERASLLQSVGLHADAEEAAAAGIPRLQGLPAETARAWIVVARSSLHRGDAQAGLTAATAARVAADSIEPWRTDASLLAAEAMMLGGDLLAARTILADHTLRTGGVLARVRRTRLEATLALGEGRVDDAITHIESFLHHDLPGDLPDWAAADLDLPAIEAMLAADRIDEAIDRAREASRRADRGRDLLLTDRLRSAWTGSRIDLHLVLVRMLLERRGPGDLAEAIAVAERARSRVLLERLGHAVGHLDEGDDDIAGWRQELRALLRRLESEDGPADQRRIALSENRVRRIRDLERRIDDRIDVLGRSETALISTTPIDLDALHAELRPDEGMLVMLPTGAAIALVLLTRSGPQQVGESIGAAEIDRLAHAIRFDAERHNAFKNASTNASTRRLAAAERRLRTLHDLFVAPLGDAISELDRLVVVPTGPAHALPLHAAIDPDGVALGERLAMTVAPSLGIWLRLRRLPRLTTVGAVVAGVSDAAAPRINDESRDVAATWGTTPLLDEHATVAAVLDRLPGHSIAHLACHGRFEPAAPVASGLRLADGWLTVRDLHDRRVPLDLLVLSGCETARAQVRIGDEIAGLPEAALRSGARRVVSSLWSVPDGVTESFMRAFHRRLRETGGVDAADALRHARRLSRREALHPAGWAAFQVHGV